MWLQPEERYQTIIAVTMFGGNLRNTELTTATRVPAFLLYMRNKFLSSEAEEQLSREDIRRSVRHGLAEINHDLALCGRIISGPDNYMDAYEHWLSEANFAQLANEVEDIFLEPGTTVQTDDLVPTQISELIAVTSPRPIHYGIDSSPPLEEPSPARIPRTRPSSDGVNNEAHNHNVMYQECFAVVGGKKPALVLIREFTANSSTGLYVTYYPILDSGEYGQYKTIPFDRDKVKFLSGPAGWVQVPNTDTVAYLQYSPGTYLRALSHRNLRVRLGFRINTEPARIDGNASVVGRALINRKFKSLEDGIRSKDDIVIPSPEIILLKQVSKGREKKFLLMGDMCVGELHKSEEFIKVYPQYKEFNNFIEQEINYAVG